jgi:hypothetical protein
MMHLLRLSLIIVIISGTLSAAFGQVEGEEEESKPKEYGNEVSGHVGSYLPNQIKGVTEILPFFGFRYGFKTRAGLAEMGFMNAHAMGVDFTTLEASLRGDIVPFENITAIFYGGPDFHYYRPIDETKRRMMFGGHFGTGLMFLIAESLWFRTEMKFNVSPGVGLYIGFGLAMRAPGGDENQQQQ